MRSHWLVVVAFGVFGCAFHPDGGGGGGGGGTGDDVDVIPSGDDAPDDAIDTDRDGVADDLDNCAARANPLQLDEDADAIGDVCDNCVGIPNWAQTDDQEWASDAIPDGVGDACDPHPVTGGDFIVGAYFVEAGGAITDWVPVAGAWVIGPDDAAQTDTTAVATMLRYAATLGPDATLELGVAVTAMGAPATDRQAAGAWIDVEADKPIGSLCEIERTDPLASTQLAVAYADSEPEVLESAWYVAIETANSALVVRRVAGEATDTGATYTCYDPLITGEVGNNLGISATAQVAADGYLGMYTARVAARFRYAVVYGVAE